MAEKFQDMLLTHLPRLQAYAVMLTRDRAAAEDLLQETALKAWRAQSQFALGTNFTAWIYKILRNEYISSLRRNKRKPARLDEVPEEFLSRSGAQENDILSREVVHAMNKLQPEQREVLVLICAGGLSYEEAAEALGCSIGTIKSRLWRARARMAALVLGEDAPAEGAKEKNDDTPRSCRPSQDSWGSYAN
jgi:RNA polymerase sigma-70 factor (ECF subfamily)